MNATTLINESIDTISKQNMKIEAMELLDASRGAAISETPGDDESGWLHGVSDEDRQWDILKSAIDGYTAEKEKMQEAPEGQRRRDAPEDPPAPWEPREQFCHSCESIATCLRRQVCSECGVTDALSEVDGEARRRAGRGPESNPEPLSAPRAATAHDELNEAQMRRRRAQLVHEQWAAKTKAEGTGMSVSLAEVIFPENALMTTDITQKEYLEMEVVLDSGAGAHVASRSHIPGYAVVPSLLSKAGAAFVGADGGRIKNHGEAALHLVTFDGQGGSHAVHSNFQIADVTRALWSVGVICDSGLNVVFAADHASVLGEKGQELCRLERRQSLYIATVKLKNPAYKPSSEESTQGFQRLGR